MRHRIRYRIGMALLLTALVAAAALLAERDAARDALQGRERGVGLSLRLWRETPQPGPGDLSAFLGRTVRLDGELFVPEVLHSPFFARPAAGYRASVFARRIETHREPEYAWSGQYSSNRRMAVRTVEHWDRLEERHAARPVFLRTPERTLRIDLPETELLAVLPTRFQREIRGERAFEEIWSPPEGRVSVIAQLQRPDGGEGEPVLTRRPGQPFRVEGFDPQRIARLEADLDDARARVRVLDGFLVGVLLLALVAGILTGRARCQAANEATE